MHAATQNMLKHLPLVDNAWIKSKMQKLQPIAYQIDKFNIGWTHIQMSKLDTL
jgi:hypothetical protein